MEQLGGLVLLALARRPCGGTITPHHPYSEDRQLDASTPAGSTQLADRPRDVGGPHIDRSSVVSTGDRGVTAVLTSRMARG